MTDSAAAPTKTASTRYTNIAAYLPYMAVRQPHTPAVVFPESRDRNGRVAYTHFTYAQLDRESNRIADGLQQIGIQPGTRTVLMVKPSLEFFALTFALFKLGAIPVMIDPGMGIKNLGQCLKEAQPEAFIGIPKAHVARLLLRWPKTPVTVTVGKAAPWGGFKLADLVKRGDSAFRMNATALEDTAAILFTSGSTGVPKGAVYTHGIFIAQVEILQRIYQIEPGEVDLATFPLFALFAPALGMTAIVPEMDATRPARVDPTKIIEAVENFGVTNMFGSPALINRVGRFGAERGIKLASLKRVISAGAPVPAQVMRCFKQMLSSEAQIFTPYGATESLPVCSIGSDEILAQTAALTETGAGVCVGKPVDEIELRIIKISDAPIAEWSDDLLAGAGEIGEITVKGPIVTRSYFNRDSSTMLAKIAADDGGWYHRMGDLGYLDADGRVWFCGRKAHRVETAEGTLFTIPCEGVFNAHPKVFRTALVGVKDAGGLKPVLCVELEKDTAADRETVKRELLEIGATYKHTELIKKILFHPGFPVDIRHNAKIFREKLANWAEGK